MTTEVRLLIVEDDSGAIAGWERSIELHNADSERKFDIRCLVSKSLAEATTVLSEGDFDAAVVDIRLESGAGASGTDTSGNEVLQLVLQAEMAVVAAFTGEPRSVVVPEGANRVKTFEKGSGNKPVIEWLADHVPMIEHIRAAQKQIKRKMAGVFVQSIWPRWANWTNSSAQLTRAEIQIALTRHIVSHVMTSLLIESDQKAHAEEWYFVPPIGSRLMTGDILEVNGEFEVVVTPRCDLMQAKGATVQLAKCNVCAEPWAKAVVRAKERKKDDELRRLLQHNGRPRQHFLPPMRRTDGGEAGPFLVQFSSIRTVSAADSDALLPQRIASLAPDFLPSLVERLGAYFSRIGTPDYLHLQEQDEALA